MFKTECVATRWVAVFDLLGTTQLLHDDSEWQVHEALQGFVWVRIPCHDG
jgi:hypothetical protein